VFLFWSRRTAPDEGATEEELVASALRRGYGDALSNPDPLVVAGEASEHLERHGLVACGRRENGVTRVDFWTREGKAYRHELKDEAVTVDDVVATCLRLAGIARATTRDSHLS
jgi:hypothetical protein